MMTDLTGTIRSLLGTECAADEFTAHTVAATGSDLRPTRLVDPRGGESARLPLFLGVKR